MQGETNIVLSTGASQQVQILLGRVDKRCRHSLPREVTGRRRKKTHGLVLDVSPVLLSRGGFRTRTDGISAGYLQLRDPAGAHTLLT